MRLWNAASSWWRVVGDASSPHLSQLSCWSGTESHVKEWDSSSYKQSTRQSVNSRSTSAKCKWFGKEMMLTSHVVLNNVTREKPHVNDQLNRRRRLQDGGRSLEWDWVRRDKRTWCLISVINALWLTCLNKDVLISTWTHWHVSSVKSVSRSGDSAVTWRVNMDASPCLSLLRWTLSSRDYLGARWASSPTGGPQRPLTDASSVHW